MQLQLSLPQAYTGVTRIDLFTLEYAAGRTQPDTICISDAYLSADTGSIPVTKAPSVTPVPDARSGVNAELLMRMATRSGPGTEYDELGSYYKAGHEVRVLSIRYDENGVPWVQVDFTAYGAHRRAYTGLKRLDISTEEIPEEHPLNYSAIIRQDVTPRYGPGTGYVKHKDVTLHAGESATVISRENGWMMLEISRPDQPLMRVWVEESRVSW